MTIALIDGDICAYRCAASAENDDVSVALVRLDNMMHEILNVTGASFYKAFLTGGNNFRKIIYPEYKANRTDKPKPRHLDICREVLAVEWKAAVTDGYEADDALGIESDDNTIVCSIDKDLLQLPGKHYNFVNKEFTDVDTVTGYRNFYKQMVLGDRTDNVTGYDGKSRDKFPQFMWEIKETIEALEDPDELFDYVRGLYHDEEAFFTNGNLLWIWRKEKELWPQGNQKKALLSIGPSLLQLVEGVMSGSTVTMPEEILQSTEPTSPENAGSQQRGITTDATLEIVNQHALI